MPNQQPLEKLTHDEKLALSACWLNAPTAVAAIDKWRDLHPRAHEYPTDTLRRYLSSNANKESLRVLRSDLIENITDLPYVQGLDRIQALISLARKAITAADTIDAIKATGNFTKLTAETRFLLKDIREEAEAYTHAGVSEDDPIHAFMKEWNEMSKDAS